MLPDRMMYKGKAGLFSAIESQANLRNAADRRVLRNVHGPGQAVLSGGAVKGAAEQAGIAAGASADDEGIGLTELRAAGKLVAGQKHEGVLAQQPLCGLAKIGYLIVDKYFHTAKIANNF